jgi:hypothetical protein
MSKEKTKSKNEKPKKKKDKSIFHSRSEAGKGDTPRTNISLQEWSDRWDKIFGIKKSDKNKKGVQDK